MTNKSKHYDYNIVVIGAGSGGLVASLIAAATQAKVALIEAADMGGDCLNTGCVPSKALIKAAKTAYTIREAHKFGIHSTEPKIDFTAVMQHVKQSIEAIAPHDSVARFTELGVDCYQAHAHIEDAHHVRAGDKLLSCRSIIIATGAKPFIPEILGISDVPMVSSDTIWQLKTLPKKLLVLGGGPIGCEMAQAFSRLGSDVAICDRNNRLIKIEDEDASALLQQQFLSEGIGIHLNHHITHFGKEGDKYLAHFDVAGAIQTLSFDTALIALGRCANIAGFGAEKLGLEIDKNQRLQANDFMATNIPNIYVCGDVTGPFQFTHAASHQAWYATVNALFSPFKRFKVDYNNMAWCTFTDPQIARVGINEKEAQQQGLKYELSCYDLADLDRAICDGRRQGFVQVITSGKSDKILGVTIVAEHAGELIAEYILAKSHGLGLNKILATLHIYPTYAEANKFAAGNWRKKHVPQFALNCLTYFHQFRRRR